MFVSRHGLVLHFIDMTSPVHRLALIVSLGSGLWIPDKDSGLGRGGLLSAEAKGLELVARDPSGKEVGSQMTDRSGHIFDEKLRLIIGCPTIVVPDPGPFTVTARVPGEAVELETTMLSLVSEMRSGPNKVTGYKALPFVQGTGISGWRCGIVHIDIA